MRKYLYFTLLGLALLTLALGGWVAKGIASVTRPSGRLAPRPA